MLRVVRRLLVLMLMLMRLMMLLLVLLVLVLSVREGLLVGDGVRRAGGGCGVCGRRGGRVLRVVRR